MNKCVSRADFRAVFVEFVYVFAICFYVTLMPAKCRENQSENKSGGDSGAACQLYQILQIYTLWIVLVVLGLFCWCQLLNECKAESITHLVMACSLRLFSFLAIQFLGYSVSRLFSFRFKYVRNNLKCARKCVWPILHRIWFVIWFEYNLIGKNCDIWL